MACNTTFNLGLMLEKEKQTASDSNYTYWVRTLRIILRSAKKEYVLDQPLGNPPLPNAPKDVANVCTSHSDDYTVVQCLMFACMEPELQKHFENFSAYGIVVELNDFYLKQERP
jgi:hypothetical protein